MYILKFSDIDCWIAPWNGNPGRTYNKEIAKQFVSKASAERAAKRIIKVNNHRKFDLIIETT